MAAREPGVLVHQRHFQVTTFIALCYREFDAVSTAERPDILKNGERRRNWAVAIAVSEYLWILKEEIGLDALITTQTRDRSREMRSWPLHRLLHHISIKQTLVEPSVSPAPKKGQRENIYVEEN
jgi:hypothetical protein